MASQQDGSPVTPTPLQRHSGVDRPFALHPPRLSIGSGQTHHYRFADFDEESFSESAGVSAEQAKRALRAHLAETERRMAEAGRLGTALVQQQKELTEKLHEVETLQAESELSPELKKKLAELEKEYDDVARETARAFLPKQRVPSNESTGSPDGKSGRRSLSPVKYESHASGSPSKLTASNRRQRNQNSNRVHDIEFAAEISTSLISQVRGLQALLAEREEDLRDTKQDLARLEDTTDTLRERIKELDESEHRFKEENWNLETRIHDLDAAQRDAADKEKKVAQQLAILLGDKNKAQRELDELKGTHARLVDEHAAVVKLHDIELGTAKRNIVLADGEKATLQRKVDELAGQNQELARAVSMQHRVQSIEGDSLPTTSEDEFDTGNDQGTPEHSPPASPVKGTPRHSVLESETLKTSLLHAQRTLQSLRTNLHREKTEKLELRRLLQDTRDDLERARADPNAAAAGATKKIRKDTRETQKLRSSHLGGARSTRTELFIVTGNDPDWEEDDGQLSPSGTVARGKRRAAEASDQFETANEGHVSDTSAFTTADDGAETTEAFHTGLEDLSSGEETMTETEGVPQRGRTLISRSKAAASIASGPTEDDRDVTNQSTASASDDDEFASPRTPTASIGSSSRMRLRASRSTLASRRLRRMASIEDPGSSPAGLQGSPYSVSGSPGAIAGVGSVHSTPRVTGHQQSLFAELEELDEDSEEDMASDGTPARFRSPQPATPSPVLTETGGNGERSRGRSPLAKALHSPKIVTVDRATLTEAVTILPWSEEDEGQEHPDELSPESRPTSFMSDVSMGERLKAFPSPPSASARGLILNPIVLPPPQSRPIDIAEKTEDDTLEFEAEREPLLQLIMSHIVSVPIEPMAEPEPEPPAVELVVPPSPIVLAVSSILMEHTVPISLPEPEPKELPVLSSSVLHAVDVIPVELPPLVIPEPPVFSMSDVQAEHVVPTPSEPFSFSVVHWQHVEPVSEPERVVEPFSFTGVHFQHVEPIPEPERVVEPFSISGVKSHHVEPVPEPERTVEPFSVSGVHYQHVEPISEPERSLPPLEPFLVSGVLSQHVEPIAEPEKVLPPSEPFSLTTVQSEHVEPISEPERALPVVEPFSCSTILSEFVEPIPEPERAVPVLEPFSVSSVQSEYVQPIPEPERAVPAVEPFSFSTVQSEYVEPISEPEPALPPPEPFSFTEVQSEEVQPVSEPEAPALPVPSFSVSALQAEDVQPVSAPEQPLPEMALSSVLSQHIEPVVIEEVEDKDTEARAIFTSPAAAPALVSVNSSGTQTDEWKPESAAIVPVAALSAAAAMAGSAVAGESSVPIGSDSDLWSHKRNAFIIPRDHDDIVTAVDTPASRQGPTTPSKAALDSLIGGWPRHSSPPTPVIAEDETRQSPGADRLSETPESQLPFREISVNAKVGKDLNSEVTRDVANGEPMLVQSDIEDGNDAVKAVDNTPRAANKPGKQPLGDSTISSVRRGKAVDTTGVANMRRPGSAASGRLSPDFGMPPLPANHREVIEAVRSGSSGSMATGGLSTRRVQTPTGGAVQEFNFANYSGTPTPKANVRSSAVGLGDMHPASRPTSRANASNAGGSAVPGIPTTLSRQTSMSSFASEVNARFGINDGDVFGGGAGGHIDPRMIQAITQTMIGEYLWKYTRKTGRSGLSEKRHRRYFWIHPYTRMLYWSDQGPTAGSRVEQRAKSVVIEGVRVVTDDNPMPPGLHRKSLVVISPGRTIKFTCTTGHGHEIWFNALSYLLLRKDDGVEDDGMTANGEQITREDVEEFNPAFGSRAVGGSQVRRQAPMSLSSYNSRTTHSESPAFGMTMSVPTLTPTPKKTVAGTTGTTSTTGTMGSTMTPSRSAAGLTSRSRLSRIGGYWRSSQSLSTQFGARNHRPHNSSAQENGIYEASEVNDSAEDMRVLFVAQDRESNRLENVRACCDGKHDVGTLSHSTRRHRHSQPAASAMSTPTHSTVRHRP